MDEEKNDKQLEEQRNTENNAKNIDNAASVAIASGVPLAVAIGAGVKVADKITGGGVTRLAGGVVGQAAKIVPGGKQLQDASNKLSESGLSDAAGSVAGVVGGAGGAGAAASGAGAAGAATSGASAAGATASGSSAAGAATNGASAAGATSSVANIPGTQLASGAGGKVPPTSNNANKIEEVSNRLQDVNNNLPEQEQSQEESEEEQLSEEEAQYYSQQEATEKREETEKTEIKLSPPKIKLILILSGGFVGLFLILVIVGFVYQTISGGLFDEFWTGIKEGISDIFKGDESYLERCYDYWGTDDNGKKICEETKGFYKRFDQELKKYQEKTEEDIPEELILYTVFYNYNPNGIDECDPTHDMTADSSSEKKKRDETDETISPGQQTANQEDGCAYNFGTEEEEAKFDEIDAASDGGSGLENLDLSIFKEERDTVRVLFKNMMKTTSVCNLSITTCDEVEKTVVDPDTKVETKSIVQENCVSSTEKIDGDTDASWWDIVKNSIAAVFGGDNEGCAQRLQGVIGEDYEDGIKKVTTGTHNITYEQRVDLSSLKQYLVESDYFDKRERFGSYFSDFALQKQIEVSELTDEQREEVRTKIWEDILSLAELNDFHYTKLDVVPISSAIGQCDTISVQNGDGSVTQVPLEDYVKGVVYAEFRNARNMEMYKAQAIAARSYVISKTDSCTKSISNSSRAQNYSSEVLTNTDQYSKMICQAVDETAGQLVVIDGSIVHAEYDAFCFKEKTSSNYKVCQKEDLVPTSWSAGRFDAVSLNQKSHGRGMSQWGALYLITQKGYDHNTVLTHYYGSGISLGTLITNPGGIPLPDLDPANGTTLESVLLKNGTSVAAFNSKLASAISGAGGRTRSGVVAGVMTLIQTLNGYGYKIPYYWGGKSGAVGVEGDWGKATSRSGVTPSGNYYYYKGLDCSGFVYWAFKQAGITIHHGSQNQRSDGVARGNLESGQPADIAVKKGHVVLILSRTANGYMIAESYSGVAIREMSFAEMRKKGYTVYNTDQKF